MRGTLILIGALIGSAIGIGGALVLIGGLRGQAGGGPAWEMTLLVGLGLLSGLVFAILAAWLTASAEVDRLAVAPTRQFLALSTALIGGAVGLSVYILLIAIAGGPGTLTPMASKLFAGALIVLCGVAGLGIGRLIAPKAYY